ncbi:putative membrane protein [Streptomyces phaeochromogenes]|jgi:hypothetical protein|uniref:hypothetical protein n=1 Tax=Streptomyces TaxID=1883 RepID=UPI0021B0EF16|nr:MULTISPECIES: hypothetical protein [Streptomyces]MDQ0951202.1 putative membrane protein [Streptomyces phaeochromogenes]
MTHAAPAPRRTPTATRPAVSAKLAIPAIGGIVYGFWTSGIDRHSGPITGWNVLLGVVSAVVFAAVAHGIHTVAPRLPREARALAWAVFAGIAFGFLYSLTDASILKSAGHSLVIAAGVFAVVFYRYYTTED